MLVDMGHVEYAKLLGKCLLSSLVGYKFLRDMFSASTILIIFLSSYIHFP